MTEITIPARGIIVIVTAAVVIVSIVLEVLESRRQDMSDDETIPECLSNPTLGAAANGIFLDVMEAQAVENRRAEVEGTPARVAKREARYPAYSNDGTGSDYADVTFGTHFDDGEEVVIPQSGVITPGRPTPKMAPGRPSRSISPSPGPSPQAAPRPPRKAMQTPSRPSSPSTVPPEEQK